MTKIQNNLIPYNKYFIDSGKFFIDSDKFTEVKIPKNFTLIDSDTGEALNDFKRSSLEIPYLSNKIYIATVKKQLKQCSIDKVLIYFSSKVAGSEYFYGIQKYHLIEVLEFLKQKGYLIFDRANDIYKQIHVRDLDLKRDYQLIRKDSEELIGHFKTLKERFNGTPENFHLFKSKKEGFGMATYKRGEGTPAKPFIKFYDKTLELMTHSKEFFSSFPVELQAEIRNNFVYRYEFTLQDKKFFDKFAISNRLEEVHEVLQEKWSEIGKTLLNLNFQVKTRKPRDLNKLKLYERIMCLQIRIDNESSLTINEIKKKYIAVAKNRSEKYKVSLLFDKIYYNTGLAHSQEIVDDYLLIKKWDDYFGFI